MDHNFGPSPESLLSCSVRRETKGSREIANTQGRRSARRRSSIPFTALIIGVLAESGNVDPVVVSSCIFMEDETSEMQADGIVKKVNTRLHYV